MNLSLHFTIILSSHVIFMEIIFGQYYHLYWAEPASQYYLSAVTSGYSAVS